MTDQVDAELFNENRFINPLVMESSGNDPHSIFNSLDASQFDQLKSADNLN